jgi:cholesterol oxidase
MKNIKRRSFIKNSAYFGAGMSLASKFAHADDNIPTHKTKTTAVVIGSGFAGSVAALRLGKAGISTIMVERGRNWVYNGPNSYPTVANTLGDGRTTWLDTVDAASGRMPVPKYTGMLERVYGMTDAINPQTGQPIPITGNCGAGLGGGSLVYGGVLLQPREDVFKKVFPNINYHEMNTKYYPRVLQKISGGTIPDAVLNTSNYSAHKTFMAEAAAAGMSITKGNVGFDWNIILKELNGELAPAASIGEYVYSCNSNAKNTLDKNYIAEAVRTGHVTVLTMHNVDTIDMNGRGRGRNHDHGRGHGHGRCDDDDDRDGRHYRVYCDVLDDVGNVINRHIIKCKYVFMAAGSFNTSKLLLKAKELGDLPSLNDQIGKHWGGNGDELMGRIRFDSAIGPIQGGPACIAAHDASNPIKPVAFMHSPSNTRLPGLPPTARLQLQAAMSVPDRLGELTYDAATDKPRIKWPKTANTLDAQAHLASLVKLPATNNLYLPGDALGSAIWHPLGGAVMGQATSDLGELYGQDNMFVIDGSLMPGSTACANPSLTIAANAERIMERLFRRFADDEGWLSVEKKRGPPPARPFYYMFFKRINNYQRDKVIAKYTTYSAPLPSSTHTGKPFERQFTRNHAAAISVMTTPLNTSIRGSQGVSKMPIAGNKVP